SINPETGRAYGTLFPFVTIRDMVRSQKLLLEHLGVTELHGVIGGSMGGMQALLFAIEYPQFTRRVLAMATTGRESAQAIAFMMAHITYVSDASMDRKFGRRKKDTAHNDAYTFDVQFEVEGYLRHQG